MCGSFSLTPVVTLSVHAPSEPIHVTTPAAPLESPESWSPMSTVLVPSVSLSIGTALAGTDVHATAAASAVKPSTDLNVFICLDSLNRSSNAAGGPVAGALQGLRQISQATVAAREYRIAPG